MLYAITTGDVVGTIQTPVAHSTTNFAFEAEYLCKQSPLMSSRMLHKSRPLKTSLGELANERSNHRESLRLKVDTGTMRGLHKLEWNKWNKMQEIRGLKAQLILTATQSLGH